MNIQDPKVAVMDQYAGLQAASSDIEAQTPLAHAGLQLRAAKSSVAGIVESSSATQALVATVLLEELPVTGLMILRAGTASQDMSDGLHSVLGLELPERLQSLESAEGCCVRWMSPDEWLLSCPVDRVHAIEQELRASVQGHIAIINVTGGFSILRLSGRKASLVLAKSTSYNINPENFPAGKVVNTVLAKAQVTLRSLGDGSYEILVRRSFADYLWLWLQRASSEYGLETGAATA